MRPQLFSYKAGEKGEKGSREKVNGKGDPTWKELSHLDQF